MGFIDAVTICLGKYVVFSGRAGRSEYWWFVLFVIGVGLALAVLDAALFGVDLQTGRGPKPISSLYQLAIFLPLLAAGWRRLHDAGRPGWHLLLPILITLAITLVLFGGVLGVSALESEAVEPEDLLEPASAIGATGMIYGGFVEFGVAMLLLWWLTRPSDREINRYGPPP